MLYCYLSDTALLAFSDAGNSTTYGQFLSNGSGAGQVTDRVMSVFNIDLSKNESPGLIIDPRTSIDENQLVKNNRLQGLFKCEDGSETGSSISNYQAYGQMCLHYDPTLNYEKNGDIINPADKILNEDISNEEFTLLFNVIETCAHMHIYNVAYDAYTYPAKSAIEAKLASYKAESQSRTFTTTINGVTSNTSKKYGYVVGSLRMNDFDEANYRDSENNRYASKVKLQSASSRKVTTKNYSAASSTLSTTKPVYFPKYFEFDFLFAAKQLDPTQGNPNPEPVKTTFRIFFDPETLLNLYGACTIRKLVFPVDPSIIASGSEFGSSINDAIAKASMYVGDTLSNTVSTSTSIPDILLKENYTGASTLILPFNGELNGTAENMTITCLYRGRTPSKEEMRQAVIDFFIAQGYEEDISTIIPSLSASATFIIVPLYDTREVYNVDESASDIDYTICKNIVPLSKFNVCLDTIIGGSSTLSSGKTTTLNIAGFNMHALAIPEKDSQESEPYALSELANFARYQAISTASDYWESMTYSEKQLNMRLAAVVTSELSGNKSGIRNSQFAITETIKNVGGRDLKCYNFVILSEDSSVDFFVIRRSSYNELFSVEG